VALEGKKCVENEGKARGAEYQLGTNWATLSSGECRRGMGSGGGWEARGWRSDNLGQPVAHRFNLPELLNFLIHATKNVLNRVNALENKL